MCHAVMHPICECGLQLELQADAGSLHGCRALRLILSDQLPVQIAKTLTGLGAEYTLRSSSHVTIPTCTQIAQTLTELGAKYTLPSFGRPRPLDVSTSERRGLLQKLPPLHTRSAVV